MANSKYSAEPTCSCQETNDRLQQLESENRRLQMIIEFLRSAPGFFDDEKFVRLRN